LIVAIAAETVQVEDDLDIRRAADERADVQARP
jgi:hypothetical protein